MTIIEIIKGKGNGRKPKYNIPAISFYCKNKGSKTLNCNSSFSKLIRDFKYVNFKREIESSVLELHFKNEPNENSYKILANNLNKVVSANSLIKQTGIDICGKWFRVEYIDNGVYTTDLSKPL